MRYPLLFAVAACSSVLAADESATGAPGTFKQYCFSCHGKAATGGISFEKLMASGSMGDQFQAWEKVADAIETKHMPPAQMPQPSDAERQKSAQWVRTRLTEIAARHAGEPGRVALRRLTSGEYAYTVKDLTGIDMDTSRDFVPDAVGGEGFTNYGDVQFMADASLERYLQAAKKVSTHAVIGAGPLQFYIDPGKSGRELSAINRIQTIYTKYGFRSVSGEGGKPFGLDLYGKAFYAAYRLKHEKGATVAKIAKEEGITERFLQHISAVVNQKNPVYPTSAIVELWNKMPGTREGAAAVQKAVIDWPRMLFGAGADAAGGQGDERALVINEETLAAKPKQRLRFNLFNRSEKAPAVNFLMAAVNPSSVDKPIVIFKNVMVRFRMADRSASQQQPLVAVLSDAMKAKVAFGKRPDGGPIDPMDFAVEGDAVLTLDLVAPKGARGVDVQAEVEMVEGGAKDAVVRVTVSDQPRLFTGRPFSVLLGFPKTPGFEKWQAGVMSFASDLPQNSQGEANPADKDPIPEPYNNVYNQPERDEFHIKVKYYRSDKFLMEKMLDDATRKQLDHAWADLKASFAYHENYLTFVRNKFKSDPAKGAPYIKAWTADLEAVQKAQLAAQPGHLEDVLKLASMAWRRPLLPSEKDKLRGFYTSSREIGKLDHEQATRALIARVLVAPAFLYRIEQSNGPLSGFELASRMSYFLWSSIPDEELRRAAQAGELNNPAKLAAQVKRMVQDPKAKRLSEEFFGQWLGFYRFNEFTGVDTSRFPEFTADVKNGMYAESVAFFDYIVRQNRPVKEILTADYTFLNQPLAKHYGVTAELKSAREVEMVKGAPGRGGLLRLGSVLTATSAPLRTSPVKRGDWVLRRVLGTPTPPPPPNAGTLPADDKAFAGKSIRERLAAHQRNATCAGCHSKIDPLGFPFEKYDPVGRTRTAYADGMAIDDSSKTGTGVEGLVQYLRTQEKQVQKNMAQKLLGYALGRTMLAGDQVLIQKLAAAGGEATFAQLATDIISSKQFRYRVEPETKQTSVTPVVARAVVNREGSTKK